eukprot:g3423.t1 g3423   contig12:2039736-2041694(+)
MSLKSPYSPPRSKDKATPPAVQGLTSFPRELHLNILTFLRATDLSALQRTCSTFNKRDLIVDVVDHAANEVYPPDLTVGFDTPSVSGEVKSLAALTKSNTKAEDSEEATGATPVTLEKVYTYEMLRNMETLVVARVLSRPEPPIHERDTCFYVSKSWCRAALRWLEVQEEERKEKLERQRAAAEEARVAAAATAALTSPKGGKGKNNRNHHPGSSGKKKKMSRKEQRQRDRRMSDAMPPWSNINNDLICEHGDLKQCSGKSARARRRTMDKQAWKVLKKLYPDSVQLEASVGNSGCLMCAAEAQTIKKQESDRKEEEKAERRKPLACPLVRGFYSRGNKGYPINCLVPPTAVPLDLETMVKSDECLGESLLAPLPLEQGSRCPLKPGVYSAFPRSWCHRWRKFIKSGEGGLPPAPDASEVLCEAHNLPLVPPHLESFLCGETSTLLSGNSMGFGSPNVNEDGEEVAAMPPATVSRASVSDADTLQALRAAGFSELEVHAQRLAMIGLEEEREQIIHPLRQVEECNEAEILQKRSITNEQLDRENRVVVEILTDDEVTALEKWWPRVHSTYALRFAVVANSATRDESEILWSTVPCRECDPSSRSTADFVMRSRLQKRGYR